MTNVKSTQFERLRRPQGHSYHIQDRYDSRGDIPLHDFPPSRLIDSPDAICGVCTREIIPVAEPYHLNMGILHVVWHAEVRK